MSNATSQPEPPAPLLAALIERALALMRADRYHDLPMGYRCAIYTAAGDSPAGHRARIRLGLLAARLLGFVPDTQLATALETIIANVCWLPPLVGWLAERKARSARSG